MIHLYYGDGKGKTSAAMGLALRMAGRGRQVIIAQFLKSSDSGERWALAALPNVLLLDAPERVKFTFQLTAEERLAEANRARLLLADSLRLAEETGCGLLVLDEVCDAVDTGLLPLETLLDALDHCPSEIVLTGHQPCAALLERADYLTCLKKERHPYDQGCPARSGIEF